MATGPDEAPVSKLELTFSCRNLPNLDTLSKSDPMAILWRVDRANRLSEVGRTEMISDDLNPRWAKQFTVDYYFEEVQTFCIQVYDIDDVRGPLSAQDFIGETRFTLGEVAGARGQRVAHRLENRQSQRRDNGTICIQAEEMSGQSATIRMQWCGRKLDKKDFFGKSDPFMNIYRVAPDGTPILVHRTEVIKSNLNPVWQPIDISISRLCNGDVNRPLIMEVWDWNRSGTHELIGSVQTCVHAMQTTRQLELALIEPTIQRKKGAKYTNSGTIVLTVFDLKREYSFLEYIAGGCEISLVVAVDFTASNGNPSQPQSLHYLNPYTPNEYYRAISEVAEILQHYDADKMFPAFGFGAKIPPAFEVSHCFPMNFNWQNPEVAGLQGILDVYMNCLRNVKLYGPTNFTDIINMSASIAGKHVTQTDQHYNILLILTDGEITDMDRTCEAIVNASTLPLSIVIVGVGGADFGKMEILDGDDRRLESRGRQAARDIVQFVPFREYRNAPAGALTKDTLAEIPTQLLSYMKSRGIVPNQPPQLSSFPSMAAGPPPPFERAAVLDPILAAAPSAPPP